MPVTHTIGLGPCIWYDEIGGTPCAAMVTRPGTTISVLLFPPDSKGFAIKETVRHVSDPENYKYAHLRNGVWDYTEESKALRVFARDNDALLDDGK